jgi:hypothetical protein
MLANPLAQRSGNLLGHFLGSRLGSLPNNKLMKGLRNPKGHDPHLRSRTGITDETWSKH